jgi:hypothetical protein
VRAPPLHEVVEHANQKFIDRLPTTSTLFAEKNNFSTLWAFFGSLEPGAAARQDQIGQVSKCATSFCGHRHFTPATPADLVLNSSTFPIPRLALAGAACTERARKWPPQRSIVDMHRPRSRHVLSHSPTSMFLVPIPKAPCPLWVSATAETVAFLAVREG